MVHGLGRRRRGRALLAALLATAPGLALAVGDAAPALAAVAPIATWNAKAIPVPATDLAYDTSRDVLLATVPGSDTSLGNELVELDPETGAIGRHVHVGSDPGPIALTDDGTTAYVGLLGAPRIVRVDLTTFSVASTFPAGPGSPLFGPTSAEDLEAVPGRNDVVVASLFYPGVSTRHGGVWAFDDGVALPNHTADKVGANRIEFGADAATLYGSNNESPSFEFYTLALNASGVTVTKTTSAVLNTAFGIDIEYAGGRVYATSGKVVDPGTHQVASSFAATGQLEVKPADSRVIVLSGTTVSVLDTATGNLVESRAFPVITGTATTLVSSGTGLATSDGTATYLLGPSVGGPPVTPPTGLEPTDFTVIDMPVRGIDLVADRGRGVVYASVSSAAGPYSNELVVIDPAVGNVVAHVPIGNNPGPMGMSDDGSRLYIGLRGLNEVVTVNLASLSVTGSFSLGSDTSGPLHAYDIEVQPGHPEVVAISLHTLCCFPQHRGVVVFDDGVRRPEWIPPQSQMGANRLAFAPNGVLFGMDTASSNAQFYAMAVDAAGVHTTKTTNVVVPGRPYDMELLDGTLYAYDGMAIEPAAPARLGRYGGAGPIEPVTTLGRTFLLDGTSLHEFDTARFRRVATRSLATTGVAADLVSIGTTLVANSIEGHIYLFTPGEAPAPISVVGQASSNANSTAHTVTIPAGVAAGDGLLLFFASNTNAAITAPTGWVTVDTVTTSASTTRVWRRVATATDAGTAVRVNVASISKANLVVVAYRGTDTTNPVASATRAAETVSRSVHATPFSPPSREGQWAVSYWTHKDSMTTALTAPAGVTTRAAGTQTGSGRVTTLIADSGGPVPAGPYGGLLAGAASASTNASTWTILLAPASVTTPPPPPPPPNQAPSAVMTSSCNGLTCSFSGTGSSDPDGTIASYAWTFGDGTAATGASVTHTYPTTGSYTATLTVTDDDGATKATSRDLTAVHPISFVGQAGSNVNSTAHTVRIPAGVVAGDAMLLFFASNTTAPITAPAGWTTIDTVTTAGSTARVWYRVAVTGDAGTVVRVDVASISKANLVVAAYRGTHLTMPMGGYSRVSETASRATHTTPTVAAGGVSGHWAVSFWTHKDSTTTALTAPAGVTTRATGTQSGSGRVTTLIADSGGAISGGPYGGLTATAAAANINATAWTIRLAPR